MMAKKKETKKEETHKTVTILCHNCAGKYGLPHSYGNKIKMEIKQAQEMIEAGDAE